MTSLTCFLGRFQPWHNGHEQILQQALNNSQYVLIICGSSYLHASPNNPWGFAQRLEYIKACLPPEARARVCIMPLVDYLYDYQAWLLEVEKIIEKAKEYFGLAQDCHIAWVGHHKDSACSYLDDLPGDSYFEVKNFLGINASDIREMLRDGDLQKTKSLMPIKMYKWLELNSPYLPDTYKEHAPEVVLAIVCNSQIMFLKQDDSYKLPSFQIAPEIDPETMVSAFAASWYSIDEIVWGESLHFKQSMRGNPVMPDAFAYLAYVEEQIDDTALIWCGINRFKTIDFWYDHSSIAHHILTKLRDGNV